MNRFFVDPSAIQGDSVEIPAEVSSQIRKVLRLKEGTLVCFLDGQGQAFESEIHYLDEKNLTAQVVRRLSADGEPVVPLTLCIALTQREKFEWILQKCTEAGVCNFVPMVTERTLVRSPKDVLPKMERWNKILKEAAEQCGRGLVPRLYEPVLFDAALDIPAAEALKVFCWEEEKSHSLKELIDPQRGKITEAALLIGPEGGFSVPEAEKAAAHGWHSTTLGERIYRVETAAIAASILTLYELNR